MTNIPLIKKTMPISNHTGLPTKNETSETTVRNLDYCMPGSLQLLFCSLSNQ